MLRTSYTELETEVGFRPLQNPSNSNIYGENPYKTFGEPIMVKGYLEMDPSDLRLQDLGWKKEPVNLIVRLPFINLLEVGLVNEDGSVNFNTDWRLVIPNKEKNYQLSNFQLREPFVNKVPTFIWVGGRVFTNGN